MRRVAAFALATLVLLRLVRAAVVMPEVPVPTRAALQAALDAEYAAGRAPHLSLPALEMELDGTLLLPPNTRLEGRDGTATLKWAAGLSPAPTRPLVAVSMPDAYFAAADNLAVPVAVDAGEPDPSASRQNPESEHVLETTLTLRDLVLDHSAAQGGVPALALGYRAFQAPYYMRRDRPVYDPADNVTITGYEYDWFNGTQTIHESFRLTGGTLERVEVELGGGNPGATAFDWRPSPYKAALASAPVSTDTEPVPLLPAGTYGLEDLVLRQVTVKTRGSDQVGLAFGTPSRRVSLEDCTLDLRDGGAVGLVVAERAEHLRVTGTAFFGGAEPGAGVVVRAARDAYFSACQFEGVAVYGNAHARFEGAWVDGVTVSGSSMRGGWHGLVVGDSARNVAVRDTVVEDVAAHAVLIEGEGTTGTRVAGSRLVSTSRDQNTAAVLVRDGAADTLVSGCTVSREGQGVCLESRDPLTTRRVRFRQNEVEGCTHAVVLRAPAEVSSSELGGSVSAVLVAEGIENGVSRVRDNLVRCEGASGHVFYLEAALSRTLFRNNDLDTSCDGRDSLATPWVAQYFLETGTTRIPNATAPLSGREFFQATEDRDYVQSGAPAPP